MSPDRQRAAAIQGCLRQLARGERLVFRVLYGPDGTRSVDSAAWLNETAVSRGEVLAAAGAAVAEMLEVEPDVCDVEVARRLNPAAGACRPARDRHQD